MPDVAPSRSPAAPTADKPKKRNRRKPRPSDGAASSTAAAAPATSDLAAASSSTPAAVAAVPSENGEKKARRERKQKKANRDGNHSKAEKESYKDEAAKPNTDAAASKRSRKRSRSSAGGDDVGGAVKKQMTSTDASKDATSADKAKDGAGPAPKTKTGRRPRRAKAGGDAGAGGDKELGVNALKGQIRQTKRFLAKPNVAQDALQEAQRRLVALERALEQKTKGEKERENASRYHKIRFFERQKLVRRIKQLVKELKQLQQPIADAQKDEQPQKTKAETKEAQLKEARVLLNYVLHYPLAQQKYIALFPLAQIATTEDEGTHDVLSLFVPSLLRPDAKEGQGKKGRGSTAGADAEEEVDPPSWLAEDTNRLASWRKAKAVRDDVAKRMEEGSIGSKPEEDVEELGSAGVRGTAASTTFAPGVDAVLAKKGRKRKAGEGEKKDAAEGEPIGAGTEGKKEKRKRKRKSNAGADGQEEQPQEGKKALQDDDFFATGDDDE